MRFLTVLLPLAVLLAPGPGRQQTSDAPRVFIGREAAIEECLRTAKVVGFRDLPVGITRPARAYFEEGAECGSALWKPLRPGMYKSFWESYKSEIAAYELDKLLGLQMVPPAVERRLNGVTGALIFWIRNVRTWKEVEHARPATRQWDDQVVRMQMFDALIGNIDRNPGNALVDDRWTMYLIDHSRAFTKQRHLPVKIVRIDPPLWERMQAIDLDALSETLGPWLDTQQIRAILARRDTMARRVADIGR